MICGIYPCCGRELKIDFPEKPINVPLKFIHETCNGCGEEVVHVLSNIEPRSWLKEDYFKSHNNSDGGIIDWGGGVIQKVFVDGNLLVSTPFEEVKVGSKMIAQGLLDKTRWWVVLEIKETNDDITLYAEEFNAESIPKKEEFCFDKADILDKEGYYRRDEVKI